MSKCDLNFGKCHNRDGSFSCKCDFGTMDVLGDGRMCAEQCGNFNPGIYKNKTLIKSILKDKNLGPNPCSEANTRKCIVTASIGQPICDCLEGASGEFCDEGGDVRSEAIVETIANESADDDVAEDDWDINSEVSETVETSKNIDSVETNSDQTAFIVLIAISILLFVTIGFVLAKSNVLECRINA